MRSLEFWVHDFLLRAGNAERPSRRDGEDSVSNRYSTDSDGATKVNED